MLATLSGEAQVGDILASYPFRLRFAPEVALACLWATSCMPVCQRDTFDLLSCLFEILLSENEVDPIYWTTGERFLERGSSSL